MAPIRKPSRPVEGGGLVGFVFGIILGFVAALSFWGFTDIPTHYTVAIAILVGIIGFFFGDRFWFWLTEKLHWFT